MTCCRYAACAVVPWLPVTQMHDSSPCRLRAGEDVLRVNMMYTVAPVSNVSTAATFAQILGPSGATLRNLTSSLGLAMGVTYQNATLYTVRNFGHPAPACWWLFSFWRFSFRGAARRYLMRPGLRCC